jgi:hypothetical protein
MTLTISNSSPHPAPTGGGTYDLNAPVTLGGQVADFDGDTVSYQWLEGNTTLFSGQIQTVHLGAPVTLPNYVVSNLSLGTHTLALTVNDGVNAAVSSSISVTIINSTPPKLAPLPNKTILWPPNHQMVNIIIQANAYNEGGGPVTLSATISSNEPLDPDGDWTQPVISGDTITLQLRAERRGNGNGRQYTISITATNISNNSSPADVKIVVPHDLGKK